MFCPKTGSILVPKNASGKKVLVCPEGGKIGDKCKICGYEPAENKLELKEKVAVARKIEVVEELENHPKIKIRREECPKGKKECIAYYWTQQTRGADEPETRFFKCTDCGQTWREYA